MISTIVLSFLTLVISACGKHSQREVASWMVQHDPAKRHPISIEKKEVVLDLPVPPGSYGLTHNQKSDLVNFAYRFRHQGRGGVLLVRTPSGGKNEIAAMRALDDVRRVLSKAGLPKHDISYEAYHGSYKAGSSPIRVSFLNHVAVGPECGDWNESLARDAQNRPYRNLGCASQRNLAAMVDNPRDLVEPRGLTPRSSERRDAVWDKYVKGEPTSAEKSDDEKTSVSDVQGGGS
jgi:pilus assembly protein CpaD